MKQTLSEKYPLLYPFYVLGIVSLGYVLGELGHYLIGATSRAVARDLHYGDIACQLNSSEYLLSELPVKCSDANSSEVCLSLKINETSYCEWDYNGLGIDYQVLAGPAFIAVFTIVGVILGIAADKYHRARMLTVCTFVFAIAIILSGSVTEYWQLVVLRMVTAAGESGCNPLATGLLTDMFPEEKRALVMSIFNWGIYGGYGIAFPVGRYIPKLDIWGLGWRIAYYGAGIITLIVGLVTWLTLREPPRQAIGETANDDSDKDVTIWDVLKQPRIIMLCVAASIRHCGGMCFAYNCDLYYQQYFPDYDLGWWLFVVTVGIGSVGVVAGGLISDKFVAKMGIRSRVMVLAVSQILATPTAFGSVIFSPVGAMICLAISYIFAEMWFGILFAILVEIVPLKVRSTTVGIFLFFMNNIGGNLPILVEPLSKSIGYREALYILYAGFYGISSILFLFTLCLMDGPTSAEGPGTNPNKHLNGVDNVVFTTADERSLPTVTSMISNSRRPTIGDSRL